MQQFPDRFLGKVSVEPNTGCWLWTAQVSPEGYGKFRFAGGQLAHRFAHEVAIGAIPKGLQIDHLCRQRSCVNPEHLDVVTQAENMRRGIKGVLTTHCPQGHAYTDENTTHNSKGGRVCRKCRKADADARTARLRSERPAKVPRTHCARGHEYSETAYLYRGKRYCRACSSAGKRRRRKAAP